MISHARWWPLLGALLWAATSCVSADRQPGTGRIFAVRAHGATADGQTLDTDAINHTIHACAAAGGGRVLFTPGTYLSGTIHLKSNVELFLEKGARLVGATNLDLYHTFAPTNLTPALSRSRWHRGLIVAEDAHDIAIAGQGIIDGQHVFDPQGEERMRGPHLILLGRCRNVVLRDVLLTNAGNYALLFFFTDQVWVTNATFAAGWDGVHFRGSPERWCQEVRVLGCQFYTGDDSIAGSYWRDVIISNCVINSSCNGIRVIGPAVNTLIARSHFFGPGLHAHRTSRAQHRTNMLAALCLQPSAWEPMPGLLDDVRLTDLRIKNVTTPFHIVTRQGNPAGRIAIERIMATGIYRAPCSVESWGESPFTNVVFKNVSVQFDGGGTPEDARRPVRLPGVDARKLPAWGFYARGVQHLTLENVRLTCTGDEARPMFLADGIDRLTLESFDFSRPPAAPELFALNQVREIDLREGAPRLATLRVANLNVRRARSAGSAIAEVTVENGDVEGLGPIELTVGDRRVNRWVWLGVHERKQVAFDNLPVAAAEPTEIRCGQWRKTFQPAASP